MVKLLITLALAGCIFTAQARDVYPSTYQAPEVPDLLIINASLYVGDGREFEKGFVHVRQGQIVAVGAGSPAGIESTWVIDAEGKWVTPGIIDVHSHLGNYPSPSYRGSSDGNEATSPVTSEVWAEHSVWPQDPQFPLALAGGVTTLQVLPGSANLFGGRSVTVKNVWSRTVQGMKFPGAPYGLKMACGENPKRVYGRKGSAPSTRMGNFAGYREAWIDALEYQQSWVLYDRDLGRFEDEKTAFGESTEDVKRDYKKEPSPPKRNLKMETLVGVLEGDILVHNHCYRADEMAQIIDLSKEFGYQVTAFHHAVEAYKIPDLLAENNICSAMWADWWQFKLESFDGIQENIPLVHSAGACAIVHSDSAIGIQRLNQEAAKALAAGLRLGLAISRAEAMTWITGNAAKALGIDHKTGTLHSGKMADLVIWSHDPFSVYARAEKVFIDGVLRLDIDKGLKPVSDFELGLRMQDAQS
ncbi:MAG: amidohydrolase [Gammaproteobacteria bacterium]|nr:amidohydrolase [Gammaproteobacteria bacterium]